MRLEVRLTGQSPLLMHNVRLADPEDEFTKAIARISDKGKKMTEDDRQEIASLEWFGGLYVGQNGHSGPVIPTANLRRCFKEAGKATNQGADITRAVIPIELNVPLIYDGPRDVKELFQLPQFVYRTMAGIPGHRTKIPRTRPQFPRWRLNCTFELVTTVLNLDEFVEIVRRAGEVEGLGDNRVNGFGRFEANVKAL